MVRVYTASSHKPVLSIQALMLGALKEAVSLYSLPQAFVNPKPQSPKPSLTLMLKATAQLPKP